MYKTDVSLSYSTMCDLVERQRVQAGTSKRITCPSCGGKNTLSITHTNDGALLWNCYKASCNIAGSKRHNQGLDFSSIKTHIANPDCGKELNSKPSVRTHKLRMSSNPRYHTEAMDYIAKNGCMDAFEKEYAHITYDPERHRVVFFTDDTELNAVGRYLGNFKKASVPKWIVYGDISEGFLCSQELDSTETVVVVEDAPSACSIARVEGVAGYALLGTHLTTSHKNNLRKFKNVVLALDNDATGKAISMLSKLDNLRAKPRVAFLDEDLKYLTEAELEEFVGRHT